MTLGFKIRDQNTGALRLDLADFTVKIVFETNLTITANGSYSLNGINANDYGAFLLPREVLDWRTAGASGETYSSRNRRPMMPRVIITNNLISWYLGPGYAEARDSAKEWRLLVVKYT